MTPVTRVAGTVDDAVARARDDATTVGAVTDADDRAGVLAGIGRALRFPAYYGANLDALEECLRDLSWLPPGPVTLVWADTALRGADPRTHRAVLAILTDVAGAESGDHPLRVVLVG